MSLVLTEEQQLRLLFEETTRKDWGWTAFDREGDIYQSRIVNAAWQAFKHGVRVGKKLK